MGKQRPKKSKASPLPILVRRPEAWTELGRDELERFVTRLCLAHAATKDPALAQPLDAAYDLAAERLSVETRLRILAPVTR